MSVFLTALYCDVNEQWELPSLVGIRHKMRRRGQEHGLVVQHEAVECLHKVLEKYISNIILACKEVAEVRRSGRGVSVSILPTDSSLLVSIGPDSFPSNDCTCPLFQK